MASGLGTIFGGGGGCGSGAGGIPAPGGWDIISGFFQIVWRCGGIRRSRIRPWWM